MADVLPSISQVNVIELVANETVFDVVYECPAMVNTKSPVEGLYVASVGVNVPTLVTVTPLVVALSNVWV